MAKWVFLPIGAVALGICALLGYQWAKSSVAKDIYRERLTVLQDDYEDLAEQYNQAITPRPVTELLVEDGIVCIGVRKGTGELIRVQTDFNIRENQVYVDYIVVDQRLLIRRAFEFHQTNAVPPDKVVYVDPDLLEVDWDPKRIPYGQAISCSRLADGRYIVSVTGDGALGLKKIGMDDPINLATQPRIEEFKPVDQRADQDVERIGVGDVWRYITD